MFEQRWIGKPCTSRTVGLLARRHIVAGEFHYIGKEASPRWAGGPDPSMLADAGALDRADETCREYNNSNTSQSCGAIPRDDTSDPGLRDDSPSTSGGDIYDLDTPGIQNGTLAKSVFRFRANFSEYATTSVGTTISVSPVNYYVRVSCKFDANGNASLDTSVTGDNQIGTGTTNTTWNLQ